MLNTFKIYEDLSTSMDAVVARKITAALSAVYEDLQKTATRDDMDDLKHVVADLGREVSELTVAQKETDRGLHELKGVVAELAVAQKETDRSLQELVVAQKETDRSLQELAVAQKETDRSLQELAVAQKETDRGLHELKGVVADLAISQKKTDEQLQLLVGEHQETRRQLGGLSMTVGYVLENESYKALPQLLQQDYGVIVRERLDREYITDKKGNAIEVNIVGKADKADKEVTIIGESKAQLSKNDVDRFIKKKINRLEGVFPEIFPILVTHQISEPDVALYAKKKGIAVYKSSQF